MSKGQWEQGTWGWSIQPERAKDCTREDPVQRGWEVVRRWGVVCRWEVPVMKFLWQSFPETLAHHDVFMSLN